MGMDLSLEHIIITKQEYESLKNKDIFINEYDLSLQDAEVVLSKKQSYYFEILEQLFHKNVILDFIDNVFAESKDNENTINGLYSYLEENDEFIINEYNLDVYKHDELNEYIDFETWQNYRDGNYDFPIIREVIELDNDKVLLLEARYW